MQAQGLKPALVLCPYAALKRRSSTVLHAFVLHTFVLHTFVSFSATSKPLNPFL